MTAIAVVTDSVAQIPPETARHWDIAVIPTIVIIEGKQYFDGVDLQADELYHRMRQEKILPTTAAPSVGQFYNVFEDCIRRGKQQIIYIGLSSQLSGVFSASVSAAHLVEQDFPQVRLHLFDSRIATIAEGYIAIEAARMAQEGASVEAILARAETMRRCVGLLVTLETLEYLALGGRIGRAAYLAADLASIKPIIAIDKNGLVEPVGRARGYHRAMQRMVEKVVNDVQRARYLRLAVLHADAAEQAQEIESMVLQQLQPNEFAWSTFTPVMGAHTGPGVVGLAYSYDE